MRLRASHERPAKLKDQNHAEKGCHYPSPRSPLLHPWIGYSFLFPYFCSRRRSFDNAAARKSSAVYRQTKFQRNNRLRHRQKSRSSCGWQRYLPWRICRASLVRPNKSPVTRGSASRLPGDRWSNQESRVNSVSGISQVSSRSRRKTFSHLDPRLQAFIPSQHSVLRPDRARLKY